MRSIGLAETLLGPLTVSSTTRACGQENNRLCAAVRSLDAIYAMAASAVT
jgi:hypothetical protein